MLKYGILYLKRVVNAKQVCAHFDAHHMLYMEVEFVWIESGTSEAYSFLSMSITHYISKSILQN
jgi:hypothetical protein